MVSKEEKRKRTSRMFFGIFTIIVMVGGGVGIFANNMGNNNEETGYNDFSFTRTREGWITEIDGREMAFTSHPLELERYNVSDDVADTIRGSKGVILTNDPSSRLRNDIARAQQNLKKKTAINMRNAFNTESEYDVPVIGCANSTEEVPVIVFEQGNSSEITKDDCIHVRSATASDFMRLSERIVYELLGVMG
ncbi:MAG: hypothetical protein ACQEP1_04900 [Nanobdellota archaeon]